MLEVYACYGKEVVLAAASVCFVFVEGRGCSVYLFREVGIA